MQIPLSRIETEYVLKVFTQERPTLTFALNGGFFCLKNGEYYIKNQNAIFNSAILPEKINCGIKHKVFFYHQKRKMCFFALVKRTISSASFTVPEIIYKYSEEIQKEEFPQLIINLDAGSVLKAGFFTPTKEIYTAEPYAQSDVLILKEILMQFFDEKSLPLPAKNIIAFTQSFKERGLPDTPFLLFSDSSYILLFCNNDLSKVFDNRISNSKIIFLNRKMNLTVKKVLFFNLPLSSSNSGILFLKIISVQEEDKRFLHERIYKEKYGGIIK